MQSSPTMTPTELGPTSPSSERALVQLRCHGPRPKYVVDAAHEFVLEHEYESAVADDRHETAFRAFDRTREAVASVIGLQPPTGGFSTL